MSTYPPNNTTPKSPSGSYLWNWLGSPLKKFAAALAPYLGDGYSYKEVTISSADLINPPATPIGGATGIELLRFPADLLQSVEWKATVEFYPGSIVYASIPPGTMFMFAESWKISNNLDLQNMNINYPMYWNNITTGYENSTVFYPMPTDPWYLELRWLPGTFVSGDGTMKVKIWYKVVNFG